MSNQERRKFSREFKLSAVGRLEAGESGSALSLELGVKRTTDPSPCGCVIAWISAKTPARQEPEPAGATSRYAARRL